MEFMSSSAVFLDSDTLGAHFPIDALKSLPVEWTFYPKTSPSETASRISDAEIVVTNKVRISRELLEKAPHLKLICVAATGYDNIDITAAKERGVIVCNAPGYSTPHVIQVTMLFILSLFSSLVPYAEDVRAGRWQKSPLYCFLDYPLIEMKGKKIGIVGYGTIGKEVGRLCEAFGMKVLIAQHLEPVRSVAGAVPLRELLPQVDVMTFHLPLNSRTRNLISAPELALMKPSAFLVNTARGGIINEADLADALCQKKIGGAALDVLSSEPPSPDNPLLQKGIPNLILTPHIAWGSSEARHRLVQMVAENIKAFLGGNPQNRI